MASFNSVILLGNLTRNPELRTTPAGTAVANFGLAVNRRYRQGDEQREEVCFIDITCFGRQAETVCEYLSRGDLAMIEGRLQWRSWETEDGQKRSKHEVVANNVQFMPRGNAQAESNGNRQQRPAVSSYNPDPEVDPSPLTPPVTGVRPQPESGEQPGMFRENRTGYGDDDLPF